MSNPLKNAASATESPQYSEQVRSFHSLLEEKFVPATDYASDQVKIAVHTLAEKALDATKLISTDAVKAIEAIIAEIDRRLAEQVNLIIHQNDFRRLEGTWRGLHHLVFKTEFDETLKVRVINVTKEEILRDFERNPDARWDQGEMFRKVYTGEYGQFGGEPYGALVGDFEFDHTKGNVDFLNGMAKIASAAHAPFFASAAPRLFGMQSWQELPRIPDLQKIFRTPEYAPWRSLRDSEDSRYIGLTMPRFLARVPYGANTKPVEQFAFEEDVDGADPEKFVWANSAFAMAANITRAFKDYGWCTQIRGEETGGLVEDLPCYTFPTDDGGVDQTCPTEIAIDNRREGELSKIGMIPLLHKKNSDVAAFFGAQSLQKPVEYHDPQATANANLSARLTYLFAACRFAHYLSAIVRSKIGSFKERGDMERWLNEWISHYVTSDDHAGPETKRQCPLREARVEVQEVEGNPGYYTSQIFLRPHYQLEGLTVALSLVGRLPTREGS